MRVHGSASANIGVRSAAKVMVPIMLFLVRCFFIVLVSLTIEW